MSGGSQNSRQEISESSSIGRAAVCTIKQGEQDSGSSPDFPIFSTRQDRYPLGESCKKLFRRDETNGREKVVVGDYGVFPEVYIGSALRWHYKGWRVVL